MPEPAPALKRELRLADLVLLNVAAVASVRWLASAAHAGPGSITLWILAIGAFFVPSGLVVVSLARRFPEEGGLYIWSRNAFGPWHGFLCAWFYFLANVLFIPGLALAAVSMSAYIWNSDPAQLVQNRTYTLTLTLILMWSGYLSHLFGLRIGKWSGNIGGAATYLSTAVLVGVSAWVAWRHGSATRFDLIPAANFDSLNMWLEEVEQFASGAGRGQKYGELLYFVRALTFSMPYFPVIFLPQMFCTIRGSKTSRWE